MADDFDPDAFLSKTAPSKEEGEFDPDAFLKSEASPSWTDTAIGVAKKVGSGLGQIGSGLTVGAEGVAAAPAVLSGMAGKALEWAGVGDKEAIQERENLKKIIDENRKGGIAQYLPEPKNTAEKYIRTASEFVPAAIAGSTASIPGAIARHAVIPGIASEAAGQLTEGTAAEPYARAGAALVTGLRGGKKGAIGPNAENLDTALAQQYAHPAVSSLEFKPQSVRDFAGSLSAKLAEDTVPELAKGTNAIVDSIGKMSQRRLTDFMKGEYSEGKTITFAELEAKRKQLNKVRTTYKSDNGEDRFAANQAVHAIDNWLGQLDQSSIAKGNIAQALPILRDARANAAAGFRGEAVNDKTQSAILRAASTYSGGNTENAVRQNLRSILEPKNKKARLGWTPEQIAMANKIVRGSEPGNVLREVGNRLGGNLGLAGAGASLATGYYTGHPYEGAAMAALWPVGRAAKSLGNRIAVKKANKLEASHYANSPEGRLWAAQQAARPALGDPRILQGATYSQPLAEGYRRGGLVNHYAEGGGRGGPAEVPEVPPPLGDLGPPPSPGADMPPGLSDAVARGEKTWTNPADDNGSFWGMTTVSEPTEAPHQVPVHYGAGAGDAYLFQQGLDAQRAQQQQIDQQYIRQMQAAAAAETGRATGAAGLPGGGDAQILAAAERPKQLADWAQFEQGLTRPDSLSWGAGNPVMSSGQKQFYPVWGPAGMRVIDRQRAAGRWQPDPGDPDYSGSGYQSGKALGFQTAFTLPGWAGGYQMVGYPGDIQGWIPWGGSGVKRGGTISRPHHFARGGPPPTPEELAASAAVPAPPPAPEWVPWKPPDLTPEQMEQRSQAGIGGDDGLTEQQQALLGHFGEARREEAGRSLLNYAMKLHGGDEAPNSSNGLTETPSSSSNRGAPTPYPGWWQATPEMTETANAFIDRQRFPFDPRRLTFDANTGGNPGFAIDNQIGTDFFNGQIPKEMGVLNLLPKSMQIFAGPGVSAFYGPAHDGNAKGGAPPWSVFFAPPLAGPGPTGEDHIWPGITHYDAWHRSLGEWANLYSKRGGTVPRPGLAR